MQKFDNIVQRLTNKVRTSATPVTGFVLGLSGTDSIITYILLNEVAKTQKFKVIGIHYGYDNAHTEVHEWLRKISFKWEYPDFQLLVHPELRNHGDDDYIHWALLHETAVRNRFWVSSTVNATEKALGTFSIMANSASISPIISLYKSEVLEACKAFGVPENIIQRSRIPDCICGRDEFAAENIELIDLLLSNKYTGGYTEEQLVKAYEYIRETKKENDFKNRTPYTV